MTDNKLIILTVAHLNYDIKRIKDWCSTQDCNEAV